MADEHYRWLDRDAAERVLRGEPLESVDDSDALRAGRLTGALDALSALPSGPDGELPGEEAALKAFREVRAESAPGAAAASAGGAAHPGGSAGRQRVAVAARPAPARRWGRPVRFGLAAAVAVCMVGGVAVAAGTGVLPSPFGDRDAPVPASSVSAADSGQPLATGSPRATGGGDEAQTGGSSRSDDATEPDRTERAPKDGKDGKGGKGEKDRGEDKGKGTSHPPRPGATGRGKGAETLRREIAKGCVEYRGGRLSAAEKQRLRESAERYGRGPADIARLCDRVLGGADHRPDAAGHGGGRDGDADGGAEGSGDGGGPGNGGGNGFGNSNTAIDNVGTIDNVGSIGSVGTTGGGFGSLGVKPRPRPGQSYSAAPQLPAAAPSPSAS
ncbi:hypothetical protein [Streptomyces sp. NPDC088785]|uniref:hypothetical protein n=1 Tax=Streptomyces sp. NPDC088785 TaxID=3365897 RepID=UPI00380B35E5